MVLILFATTFLISCASTNFENIENISKFEHVEDEKSLWKEVEEVQKKLVNSSAIYPDKDLQNYVNGVLDKLVAGNEVNWGADIEAHVIYNSDFNAAMWPNGFMIVHTGLLAHLDNEAQLATILGHELTHFLHRHSLKSRNKLVNITAALGTIRVAAVGAAYGLAYNGYDPSGIDDLHNAIALGFEGAYYGYSRATEFDADEGGFDLVKERGYDVKEAKAAMENMLVATELVEKKGEIPYFYSSHPKTKLRIKNYSKFINDLSKDVDLKSTISNGEQEYMNHIKNMLIDNLSLDIKKKNIKLAKRQIERYSKAYSDDYKSLYYEAMILLREDKKDEAIEKLSKSKQLNSQHPDTLKELGVLLYKKGDKDEAKDNFRNYLILQPDAKDADFIRRYLDE